MNYVKVVTAQTQKEQAIRKLKELVSELARLTSRTRNIDTHSQLDCQILRLKMYITHLEVELENGIEEFDREQFNEIFKQVFKIKRKFKGIIHQEEELKRMKIPATLIVLLVMAAVASAFVVGIVY